MLVLLVIFATRIFPSPEDWALFPTHVDLPPATHCVPYVLDGSSMTSYECVEEAACEDALRAVTNRPGAHVLGGCTRMVDPQCFETYNGIFSGLVCRPGRAACERERESFMRIPTDVLPCTPPSTPYVVGPQRPYSVAVSKKPRASTPMSCYVVGGSFRCMRSDRCTRSDCVETNVWCFRVVLPRGEVRESCHPMFVTCNEWRYDAALRGATDRCTVAR